MDGNDPALARRVRPHTTGGERRCLGDPLPRLAQSALLVPGAERFAPWVRKVHFITWGHLPAWLRRDHPKLHRESRDFIPAEYLPTFNSNTIELNIHRIEGVGRPVRTLQRRHTFLLRGCRPEDFFAGVCPATWHAWRRTTFVGRAYHLQRPGADQPPAINARLSPTTSPGGSRRATVSSACLKPSRCYPGASSRVSTTPHAPALPHGRFRQTWERWPRELDASCRHRIRSLSDLSHWLVRYDMLASGALHPARWPTAG